MLKKRIMLWGLFGMFVVTARAQNPSEHPSAVRSDTVRIISGEVSSASPEVLSSGSVLEMNKNFKPSFRLVDTTSAVKPLLSPLLTVRPSIAYYPDDYWYGGGLWSLHEGFNASLSMSVTASFGRNRFPGVGFGTGVSAMYAKMLTDRLVLAVGGFYNHLSWNNFNENHFGLNVMMGYHFNDRVSLYAYGSKAFWPTNHSGMIPPFPYFDAFGERFGGLLHIKFNDNVSFSVGIEERRR